MQLEVLRELCGQEVTLITKAARFQVQKGWQEVLVLDIDGSKRGGIVAGRAGSLDPVLRKLAEMPVLEAGHATRYHVDWRHGRCVLRRMRTFPKAWGLEPAYARLVGNA